MSDRAIRTLTDKLAASERARDQQARTIERYRVQCRNKNKRIERLLAIIAKYEGERADREELAAFNKAVEGK